MRKRKAERERNKSIRRVRQLRKPTISCGNKF